MKNVKKFLSLALAITMLSSVAFTAGCGKKEEPKNNQATTEKKEELKPVELSYYLPFGALQADQDQVFAKANEIIKKEINATVKFNVLDQGTFKEKMPVIIASGEQMDLMFTAGWLNDYAQNVAKSALVELDPLLEKYGKNILKDIPKGIMDTCRVNGKLYGVPNYQIESNAQIYMAKKDLVDKYKFDTKSVKTWKDLEPFLKAVKEGEKDIIPLEHRNGLWGSTNYDRGFEIISDKVPGAVKFSDKDAKIFNQFASPEYKEFVETMHDWYQKGYIQKDILSVKDNNAERKAGKLAVVTGGNRWYEGYNAASFKTQFGYDMVEMYAGKLYMARTAAQGSVTGVSTASKNPERAVMYLDLLDSNADLANLLAYGIEGKHYTKNSDNKTITLTKDSGYNHGRPWAMMNIFKTFVTSPLPADHYEKTLKANEEGTKNPSPLMGISINLEPVKSQIAQVTTVYEEIGKGLEAGVLDPKEYLPKYLDKLEKAGASQIIAEFQKQVDSQKKK